MPLTLHIENVDTLPDGGPVTFEVERRGIDIGRDAFMDWTLPDPERFISGKHCEVHFRDNGYWLHDVSTNGTSVNGRGGRLTEPYMLQNGDRIHIGAYIVVATISDVQGATPAAAGAMGGGMAPAAAPGDPWGVADSAAAVERRDFAQPAARPADPGPGFGGPDLAEENISWGVSSASPGNADPADLDWSVPSTPNQAPSSDDFGWGAPPPSAPPAAAPQPTPPAPVAPPPQAAPPSVASPPADESAEAPAADWRVPPSGGEAGGAPSDPFGTGGGAPQPNPAPVAAPPAPTPEPTPEPTPAPPVAEAPAPAPAPPPVAAAPVADAPAAQEPAQETVDEEPAADWRTPPPSPDAPAPPAAEPPAPTPEEAPLMLTNPVSVPSAAPPPADNPFGAPEPASAPPAAENPFAAAAPTPAAPQPQQPVAAPQAPPQAGAAGAGAFIAAFERGAGLPAGAVAGRSDEALAEELGMLFKDVSNNLQAMLLARAETKSAMRSSERTMIGALENNPLKFSPSAEDAMRVMFGEKTRSYLDATQTVQQSFADLQRHQLQTFTAMQQALGALIEDLDPENIAGATSKDGGLAAIVSSRRAKLWDTYVERFKSKSARHERGMIDAFMILFAEMYDRQG